MGIERLIDGMEGPEGGLIVGRSGSRESGGGGMMMIYDDDL